MKLKKIELIHLKLPLVHFFETSFGRVHDQETVIVRVEGGGEVGWGEAPASARPGFSYETVQTVMHVARDFLAGRLKDQDFTKAGPIADLFGLVRGHNMAKGALEAALLDLFAKVAGKPLTQLLGGTQREIPTGISLGIEDTIDDLLRRIDEGLARGYQRIKLKIKPRWDLDVLKQVRRRHPAIPLSVDANGAYTLADLERLKELDAFNLMMIEQPLDHDDIVDHAKLQSELETAVCLDESIRSYGDARRALELGSCRIVNIKPPRVGGPFNAKMIHNLCLKRKVPVWCGGLLETGIGRAHNIAVASLPGFTLPGDLSASSRYWKEDVIDPPVEVTAKGTLRVPSGPGIGYTVVESRLAKYTVRRETILG